MTLTELRVLPDLSHHRTFRPAAVAAWTSLLTNTAVLGCCAQTSGAVPGDMRLRQRDGKSYQLDNSWRATLHIFINKTIHFSVGTQ